MKTKKIFKGVLFFVLFAIFSCANLKRSPTSDESSKVLQNLYTKNMLADLHVEQYELLQKMAQIQNSGKDYSSEIEKAQNIKKEVAQSAKEFTKFLEGKGNALQIPQTVIAHLKTAWRKQVEVLNFRNINDFELQNGSIKKYFMMSRNNATDYELTFHNIYYSKKESLFKQSASAEDQSDQPYLEFKMICDGDFKIDQFIGSIKGKTNKEIHFRLYDDQFNAERIRFIPSNNLQSCEMRFINPDFPKKIYGLKIIDQEKNHSSQAPQHQMIQGCMLPSAKDIGPVENLFLTVDYNSMTCPSEINYLETLEDPIEGFQAKVHALLGQRLSNEFILAKDPFLPIDFSLAPKLDEIDITNLVFRNDYYGAIVRRLIEYHAEKGTLVRILIAKVIALEKDLISFDDMVAKYGNVKIIEYKWASPPAANFSDLFSTLHKTNHVKMLLTLSASDPSKNTAIIGGRNIHDGFVFSSPQNLSKYPNLVQYPKDESWAFWRDIEYLITDSNEVINFAAHFMTLWEMDSNSFYQRSLNYNLPTGSNINPDYFKSNKPLVRHFISIPFKDHHNLEHLYVDMINSAQKELILSTPYFNLTKQISKAFQQALERGVKISLITRLDLKGDTVDFILSDVNKKAVNKFKDKFSIFEYTVPNEILHSKIVLIDGKLSFVGSVNLNHRSFLHDTENIMMVYSAQFNQKMTGIVSSYIRGARQVKEAQKLRFINKMILRVPFLNDSL